MDDVFDQLEEYEETIDELEKQVTNLRVKVGSKEYEEHSMSIIIPVCYIWSRCK